MALNRLCHIQGKRTEVIEDLLMFSSHVLMAILHRLNSMCITHLSIYQPFLQEMQRKTRGFGKKSI